MAGSDGAATGILPTVPAPESADRHTKRPRNVLASLSGAAVILLVAVGALVWHNATGAQALTVTRLPLDERTPNAFTPSVATIGSKDAKALLHNGAADARTGTSGVPAIIPSRPVCDTERLIRLITSDRAKASVWAAEMGIRPSTIAPDLRSLTPALLAADVAATDHRYLGGRATTVPVVLQSGTAVLLDASGFPRVRCLTGDPISHPTFTATTSIHTVGPGWSTYDPGHLIYVEPPTDSTVPQTSTVHSTSGGPATTDPSEGTVQTISLQGRLVIDHGKMTIVDDDGNAQQVESPPVADAHDDGAGDLVYQVQRSGAAASTDDAGAAAATEDAMQAAPRSADEAAIWLLPSNETEPTKIVTSDDFEHRWNVVVAAGRLGGHPVVLYAEVTVPTDGDDEADGSVTPGPEAAVPDPSDPATVPDSTDDFDATDPSGYSAGPAPSDGGSSAGAEGPKWTLHLYDVTTKHVSALDLPGGGRSSGDGSSGTIAGATIAHDSILIGVGDPDVTWYLAKSSGPDRVGAATTVDTSGWSDFEGADQAGLTDAGDFVVLVPSTDATSSDGTFDDPSDDADGDDQAPSSARIEVRNMVDGRVVRSIDVSADKLPDDGSWPTDWNVSGDVAIGVYRSSDDTASDGGGAPKGLVVDLGSDDVESLDVGGIVRHLQAPVKRPKSSVTRGSTHPSVRVPTRPDACLSDGSPDTTVDPGTDPWALDGPDSTSDAPGPDSSDGCN